MKGDWGMKIAVTLDGFYQVSQEEWRDKSTTKIFEDTVSIAAMLEWARTRSSHYELSDLKISEVVE